MTEKRTLEEAEDRIRAELPALIDRLLDLARGVLVYEEEGPNGVERVYRIPPDFKALSYLLDRVMGRPAQRMEMSGEGLSLPTIITMMPRAEAIAAGLLNAPREQEEEELE
jgi:hypothetical protein